MILALLILVGIVASVSVKNGTTFGWFQSTIIGLLCVVPFLLGLIVDALNLGVSLLFRLAFILGGSNLEEVMASAIAKQLELKVVATKGDRCYNEEEDSDQNKE